MVQYTEGNYDPENDTTELIKGEWDFDNEKTNKIMLPAKIKKDLKKDITQILKDAYKRARDKQDKSQLLSEKDIRKIREKFYETNSKLFP